MSQDNCYKTIFIGSITADNDINEQNPPISTAARNVCNSPVEHTLDPSLPPPLVLSNRQIQYFLKSFVSKMKTLWDVEYYTIQSYELMYMFGKGVRTATAAIHTIMKKALRDHVNNMIVWLRESNYVNRCFMPLIELTDKISDICISKGILREESFSLSHFHYIKQEFLELAEELPSRLIVQ